MRQSALIGHTGYVGSTLLRQTSFDKHYRSTTISEISNQAFDLVVCAGAPAQKWIANREPEADLRKIQGLIAHLETLRSERFVLVSTVDVFKSPNGVDENTEIDESGLHPYGLHRRMLEKFVESHFQNSLIIRLPGLVGPGLRKNIIFDFLNDNNLQAIESRSAFQFYPMVNLWFDIQTALEANLRLIHLTAEPITVKEVSRRGFGRPFDNILSGTPATYDMKTIHASTFGRSGNYQYSKAEEVLAIRAYAQSEPRISKQGSV